MLSQPPRQPFQAGRPSPIRGGIHARVSERLRCVLLYMCNVFDVVADWSRDGFAG